MSKTNILIIVLFVAAAALRFTDIFRPINQALWRECDLGAVSRNFVQEGMDPFYPRIDWRGNGPGYAEMELPLYPWLTAAAYQVVGVHDNIGRVWAFLFSLGALFFFFRLAREYLGVYFAVAAFAFFAFNPLVVEQSTAVQPEGLMLFAYIAAVYFFVRWIKTDAGSMLAGATAMTALALLAKAPSAHIGLFFAILLFNKYGWRVLTQAKVWLFGIVSLLPAALWYIHAKGLWKTYGNSLGVSNEYHWVGWDLFTNSQFITGILRNEFVYVWVCLGVVAAGFALWQGYREETGKRALLWFASIFILYILASRTTSDEWAYYYHIFSVPPAALLFGLCIKKLWDYVKESADNFSSVTGLVRLGRAFIIMIVAGAAFATIGIEAKQVRAHRLENRLENPAFAFAERVKPMMRNQGLILVSGGYCKDPDGYEVAYNASYMFYWLEKKGWNVCVEDQSVERIREFRQKGAMYFVGEKKYMREAPLLGDELRQIYRVTAETEDFVLFDLNHEQ